MSPINSEKKRKEVIEFIKKNPKSTYKQLKQAGYSHLERLFKDGLREVYEKLGIKPPRTPKNRTLEERRMIIIDYIKKNPTAGGQTITKNIKISIRSGFKTTKDAFEAAGVPYLHERLCRLRGMSKKEKRERIFSLLRNEPESTFEDIRNKTEINPYKIFKNLEQAYNEAGIIKINIRKKRKIKKQKIILEFIRANPLATQREINLSCKTRIQGLFEQGIFGAYKEAGIEFPFERLRMHGTAIKEVKQRAKNFEEEIAQKLACYGKVNRLVKTKSGVADIILERNNRRVIIEVKDYLNKEVSKHEIKQLNRYLGDCNCNLGFLICHDKPKKDRFLIGKNELIILTDSELNKISELT